MHFLQTALNSEHNQVREPRKPSSNTYQTKPASMGNRISPNSKVHHGQVTRVASTELGYDYDQRMGRPVAKFRDEYIDKSMGETPNTLKGQHGIWVYSDNNPLDNDETFTTFIQHAKSKYKTRTASHIGREKSFVAPAPPPDDEANQNKFSNFIQSDKKKLGTSSSKRKNGSFKVV